MAAGGRRARAAGMALPCPAAGSRLPQPRGVQGRTSCPSPTCVCAPLFALTFDPVPAPNPPPPSSGYSGGHSYINIPANGSAHADQLAGVSVRTVPLMVQTTSGPMPRGFSSVYEV